MLKGFLGGAVAVPRMANVGLGITIPTRAQQKWPGSGPMDWLQHQSYGRNVATLVKNSNYGLLNFGQMFICKTPDKDRKRKHESQQGDKKRREKSMSREKRRRENDEESWRKEIEKYEESHKKKQEEKRDSKEHKDSQKSR
uniref:Uncharacterized protein n=1 Tax=Romanomermis culicivorax TaxID=13658 RepID=A0A915JPM3_ROMCU